MDDDSNVNEAVGQIGRLLTYLEWVQEAPRFIDVLEITRGLLLGESWKLTWVV